MANSKKKTNKEGIVIFLSSTKENDAMVNAIGPEGVFSFYARGINKINSKNAGAVQTLSHSIFTLSESSSGHLSLFESKAIESFLVDGDIESLACENLIQELTKRFLSPDDSSSSYPWLLASLSSIKKGFSPFTSALIYFAYLLRQAGYGLDVDECIICHKKQGIVGLSYEEGGFICQDDLLKIDATRCNSRKLKIIRYIFRLSLADFERIAFEKEESLEILKELSIYLENMAGIKLRSISIIEKL